ncbi:nuclear fragile X mental retardation-interacting protein 1 isoform X1 [Drosophila mojavensis]|uniref:nuclear fragile X mental retardation-interacting protein 1 isoform X1 n=2 Tax=Drosophila mojavensis TaxID=7230 RepID=UPI001CD076AB|nr:nuclear fragile X mental retardation-interacting protein 1 isoform X1 [Drosophila mojavensis]
MEQKFLLPSPNFNKTFNKPNKTNLHYLTPSGMTLLSREKQPPPMYGAHGSTVAPKYFQVGKQQNISVTKKSSNYSPSRTEYCGNCKMELATSQDMRRHFNQHQSCPAEECSFTALSFVMERHIEANHITGLYKTVKKVWTPQNIAAWRAERCKRFPTAASVKIAKLAKEQRLKRGERLEASKMRFGMLDDRRNMRLHSYTKKQKSMKEIKKLRCMNTSERQSDRQKGPKKVMENTTLEDPSNSCLIDVPIFRGTSKMIDYKHIRLNSRNKVDNALSNMFRIYDTDTESENEASDNNNHDVRDLAHFTFVEPKITVDDYDDNSDDTKLKYPVTPLTENITKYEFTIGSSSSDEGPDDVPIERNKDPISSAQQDQLRPKVIKAFKSNPFQKKKSSGLNYMRARQLNNLNTMLSKLLESEIRHERNVLLQCVRYVCEKNFFDL